MRCLSACDKFDCKCPSQNERLRHQLVQGNLPSDSVCCICGIVCSSPFGLHGLRCLWCNRTVDEACSQHLSEFCDLGPLVRLILPPNLVRLNLTFQKSTINSITSLIQCLPAPNAKQIDILADFSNTAQKYMKSVQLHLKEGLTQVQEAMAAGLFEGLKEWRRRLRQQKTNIKSVTHYKPVKRRSHSHDHLTDKKRSMVKSASDLNISLLSHRKYMYDSTDYDSVSNKANSKPSKEPISIKLYSKRFSKRLRSGSRSESITSSDYNLNVLKQNKVSCLEDKFRIQRFNVQQYNSGSRGDYYKAFLVSENTNDSESLVDLSQKVLSKNHHRVKCLEEEKIKTLASELVDKNRYVKRLNTLAKLMPVKADVWEIELESTSIASLILRKTIPVLVFVNLLSGGGGGQSLLKEFYKLLNPNQVVIMEAEASPRRALDQFKSLAESNCLRILVCGGDGSAGWVINEMQNVYSKYSVPLGILPLGTGNDLSRVLGWGSTFTGNLLDFLLNFDSAKTQTLDLWNICVTPQTKSGQILNATFTNYMDIGVAARIALRFHQLRKSHPELFQSQLGNKFLYGEMGFRDWVSEKPLNFLGVKIFCDDEFVVLKESRLEGIIVINIPSFSGGVNLWPNSFQNKITSLTPNFFSYPNVATYGASNSFILTNRHQSPNKKFNMSKSINQSLFSHHSKQSSPWRKFSRDSQQQSTVNHPFRSEYYESSSTYRKVPLRKQIWSKQSMQDRLIEVVGLRSLFHLGQVQVGLAEPIQICQGRKIRIEVPYEMPLQIDGEPRVIPPSIINITYKSEVNVLTPSQSRESIATISKFTQKDIMSSMVYNSLKDTMENWKKLC